MRSRHMDGSFLNSFSSRRPLGPYIYISPDEGRVCVDATNGRER